jgi:hypothetical protein
LHTPCVPVWGSAAEQAAVVLAPRQTVITTCLREKCCVLQTDPPAHRQVQEPCLVERRNWWFLLL